MLCRPAPKFGSVCGSVWVRVGAAVPVPMRRTSSFKELIMTAPMYSPVEMLDRLIGFASVVGTSNEALMQCVASYLRAHGVVCHLLPGPEGGWLNLFATIGDASRPGYILSGHVDVVPATEPGWRADPVRDAPRRGAADWARGVRHEGLCRRCSGIRADVGEVEPERAHTYCAVL